MWQRVGILFLMIGLVPVRGQVTNPLSIRSTVIMLPATYAGETYNAVQFEPRADGLLRLWPRNATEGGGGGTNVAGITNLNGITNASQSFATGTTGTDFDISSAGSTHTFNLPTASSGARGALASADWSAFNAKQGAITVQTNGVTLASFPTTWNFGPGLTGYVSGATMVLGNSVAGGGDVTTAQLLYVSNQVVTASNVLQADVNTRQGGSDTLTNLAGLGNTNKLVFTNDAWLERVASNRVEVAAGAGISVASANSGNKQVFTVTATGSGTPGGNAGAIQFNQSGNFEGTNDLYYDRTNGMGYLSGLTPSWTIYKLGSGVSTVRVDSSAIRLHSPQADPHLDIVARNDPAGISGGINIYTNRVSGALSNHMSLGSPIVHWNTSFVNVARSAQAIELGFTNGGSGIIWSNQGLFKPTNVLVLNITNPVAGQVLKISSVNNLSGGMVVSVITNDTDATGGGGGGGAGSLPMDLTQFDTNGTVTVKEGALFTNTMNRWLSFTDAGAPARPATNTLTIGKDSYAGRGMLEWWGDQGLSIAAQPWFGNNRISMLLPSAAASLTTFGVTFANLGGVSISHPPPTEQWPYMAQIATPATSNACAGIFSSVNMTTMGTRYGMNGYFLATEFLTTNLLNQHTLTAPAGNRLFIGRTSTASPNLTNIVNTTNGTGQYAGLYVDSGHTNQFFLTARDGTAEFRTNTGMLWVATNLYQFYMMQAPTSRMLAWKLRDLTSNTVAQGWFSNNVPTNMMKFGYLIRNGTTVVNSVRFSKLYVEAPLSP